MRPSKQIETLRRLGVFKKRGWTQDGVVYRVRRGKVCVIAAASVHRRSGNRRRVDGTGRDGRMDWERQRRVLKQGFLRHGPGRWRGQLARERADRWDLSAAMDEWLYTWETWAMEHDHYDDEWDDWDETRDCSWTDLGWSVTFVDLMPMWLR